MTHVRPASCVTVALATHAPPAAAAEERLRSAARDVEEQTAPHERRLTRVAEELSERLRRESANLVSELLETLRQEAQRLSEGLHRDLEAGTSPVTVDEVTAGSHIVEARLSGHEAATSRVTIEPGRRETVRLEMTRSASTAPVAPTPPAAGTGFISVTSDAPGSEVVIDDVVAGPAPLTNHEVAAGQHRLVVRAEGFQPHAPHAGCRSGRLGNGEDIARSRCRSGGGG